MIEAVPEGSLLILDEAYVECAPAGTAPPIDTSAPQVIRMRTFSKAYGLAGARVGYAIGHADLIQAFNKVRNHFAMNRVSQAGALAAHLGLDALLNDPRFRTRADRKGNREALNAAIEEVLKTRPAAEWESELNAIGVPAGRILSLPQALEQADAAGQIATYDVAGRQAQLFRTGMRIDGAPLSVDAPPPELGQDTATLLDELGFSETDISRMRQEGVI